MENRFVLKGLLVSTLCLLFLTACGGGGGGGGGSDKSSSPQNSNASFSLENNAIELKVTTGSGIHSYKVGFQDVSFTENVTVTKPSDSPGWLVAARVGQTNPGSPSPRIGVEVVVNANYMTRGIDKAKITVAVEGRGSRIVDVSALAITPIQLNQTSFQSDFIYGSDFLSQWTVNHFLTADFATSWSASSNQPWVSVTPSSSKGAATLQSTIDISGLGVGTFVANINIQDDDFPFNSATISHVINLTAPVLNAPDEVTINGPLGTGDESEKSLEFSIKTGTKQHPYTVSFTNASNETWLDVSPLTGTVDESGQTIQLTTANDLAPGVYNGTLTLTVDVDGYPLTKPIPIAFYKEVNRLVAQSNGVSLLKSPSRSLLTKDVKIVSSLGRNNIPWQAVSDQNWLSATLSGVTGDSLTLIADTSDLTPDTYYSASISISSSDPEITNTETIRVGLHYLNDDSASMSVNIPEVSPNNNLIPYLVTSPVEPIAFVAVSNQILAYNVHTGTLDRSFSLPLGPVIKGMTISSDGLLLYVYGFYPLSSPSRLILELNAQTGAVTNSFEPNLPYYNPPDSLTPSYVRPAGVPHLVNIGATGINLLDQTPTTYNGTDGIFLSNYSLHPSTMDPTNPMRTVLPDGLVLNLMPSSIYPYTLWASAANTTFPQANIGGCLNDSATQVFARAWSNSEEIVAADFPVANDAQLLSAGASLVSIACWSGQRVLAAMLPTTSTGDDAILFDANSDAILLKRRLAPAGDNTIRPNGIALSGDGKRIVAITENSDGYDQLIMVDAP